MKRWLLAILVVTIALSSAVALRSHIKSEAKQKREAVYQTALRAYSQNLKPGLARKQVEDFRADRRHNVRGNLGAHATGATHHA